MAEKLGINELRRAIMARTGANEQEVSIFLNSLVKQVIAALRTERQVRITGLGTFKLQAIAPRKSVNVVTGEPFVIEGYNKIILVPEAGIKELISSGVNSSVLADSPADKETSTPVVTDDNIPLRKLGQQADEIVDILAELGQGPKATNAQEEKISSPEPEQAEEPKPIVNPTTEPTQEPEVKSEVTPEVKTEIKPEPEIVPETQIQTPQPQATIVTPQPKIVTPQPQYVAPKPQPKAVTPQPKPKKKHHYGWIWLVVVLLLIIAAGICYYIWFDKVNDCAKKCGTKVETLWNKSVDKVKTISWFNKEVQPADSVAVTPDTIPAEPVVEEVTPQDVDVTYDAILRTIYINEGSRLAWLSYRYYGDKTFWVYIYDANKDHLSDPNNIETGTPIRIPKLSAKQRDLSDPETQQLIEQLKQQAMRNCQ